MSRTLLSLVVLSACSPGELVIVDDHAGTEPVFVQPEALDLMGADGVSWMQTETGLHPLRWAERDGRGIFEGDIILGDAVELATQRGHTIDRTGDTWNGAVVPYEIDPALPDPDRVRQGMIAWERHTAVRFVPRTTERDYVEFVPGTGCSSSVGRTGRRQEVLLAPGCGRLSVMHELGHVVGLYHEHTRRDRDAHVQVLADCIDPAEAFNFDTRWWFSTIVGAYDADSVMHYGSSAFVDRTSTLPDGTPCSSSMLRNDGSLIDDLTWVFSAGDLAAVDSLYGPPAESLELTLLDEPQPGSTLRVQIDGALPGERVQLWGTLYGLGDGRCIRSLAGGCLDLVAPAVPVRAVDVDPSGSALVTLSIPAGFFVEDLALQGLARRGADGEDSLVSMPVQW